MKTASFKVQSRLCGDCSMALRRFLGNLEGVHSIDVGSGVIAVKFNESEIDEAKLTKIAKDSIERLGYRVEE